MYSWASAPLTSGNASDAASAMSFDLNQHGITFYGLGLDGQIVADVDFPLPMGPDNALRAIEDAALRYANFALSPTAAWTPEGNAAGTAPSGFLAAANKELGFTGTWNFNALNDASVAVTKATSALAAGGSAIGKGAYSAWSEVKNTAGSVNDGIRKDIGAAVPIVVAVSVGIVALACAYIYTIRKIP